MALWQGRQTSVIFFLVILTSIILIILFCTKHGAYSFMSPSFKKVSISTSGNFVPTENYPEYGVKAQEIPLFVCNTSDILIGWFEFKGNGKFQTSHRLKSVLPKR